jgi:hypothetical protein
MTTTTNTNTRVTMLDEDNMIIDNVDIRRGMAVQYDIEAYGLIAVGNGLIDWNQSKGFCIYQKWTNHRIWILEQYCRFTEENGRVFVRYMMP